MNKFKTIKKKFDCVKMMREIRNKIDKEIAGMSFEEEQEYFQKGVIEYKKQLTDR